MMSSANPLLASVSEDEADADLVVAAAGGDAGALDRLVRRHQTWIYNLALRFMLNPDDAADLAQDALTRIITHIGKFQGRASFRTWAYRIVTNAFMDAKRGKIEQAVVSFDAYGADLNAMPNQPLQLSESLEPERALLLEETKNGCMLGMLLCLSREQRLAYILGEIFQGPSYICADILNISPAAFRKRLQRARADLVAFMQNKCGLINKTNPCRCERKTRSFIDAGYVDPQNMKFAGANLQKLKAFAPLASQHLDRLLEERYAGLFRDHPLYPGPDLAAALSEMLADDALQTTFHLNSKRAT